MPSVLNGRGRGFGRNRVVRRGAFTTRVMLDNETRHCQSADAGRSTVVLPRDAMLSSLTDDHRELSLQRAQLKIEVRSDEPVWTPAREALWRRIAVALSGAVVLSAPPTQASMPPRRR